MKIGWIGMGVMGHSMAGHLLTDRTFAAYTILAISAYAAHSQARPALFLVGSATLLLLFIGIHNAWDAVTYHVFVRLRQEG